MQLSSPLVTFRLSEFTSYCLFLSQVMPGKSRTIMRNTKYFGGAGPSISGNSQHFTESHDWSAATGIHQFGIFSLVPKACIA